MIMMMMIIIITEFRIRSQWMEKVMSLMYVCMDGYKSSKEAEFV